MKKHKNIFYIFIIIALSSCDLSYKNNGQFGHSETKEEAFKNGSPVCIYIPNKYSFRLLDGMTLLIDTAWTEASFSYYNGKRKIDINNGYHFSIPFKKKVSDSFTFDFCLEDKNNQAFSNGIEESHCQLCPMELYDSMKVLLEQKDPDTSKGWTHPIITDTIIFKRLK